MKACLSVQNDRDGPEEVNETLVTLIPKILLIARISRRVSFEGKNYWRSVLGGVLVITITIMIGGLFLVSLYHDCWIPWLVTFKVQSPILLGNMAKVADQKRPFGGWNERLIREVFWPYYVSMFRICLYESLLVPDSLTWHLDKLGSYSVKSGYHFGCELLTNPSSPGLSLLESWWKFLWCLRVPGKGNMLIWRACYNWIPLSSILAKCGVAIDLMCHICKLRSESSMHALWCCPSLKKVRSMCYFMKGFQVHDGLNFQDFMLACKKQFVIVEMEFLCMLFGVSY
ncbi:hypothetical protein Dsin_000962 [Dipteronia sinensis]|uniref:Reverse transcriptase zinc-binding domain-containing protein n=1 Tax=Dipteronia sinensis TaxID=43782 RepID=A0AAE0B3G5_9ROSI|nr:hypothetical protein Dsin_000962 [Dipteronia sinensis]